MSILCGFPPPHAEVGIKGISIQLEYRDQKGDDPSIRHMGPMAQDLYAAFGLDSDERYINTQHADGVALAAVKGLYEMVKEKDAQIATLEGQIDEQQGEIDEFEARLAALEAASA